MRCVVKMNYCLTPGPSLKKLKKKVVTFKCNALAKSTVKARKSQWACYRIFCNRFNVNYRDMSVEKICLYVVFLSEFLCYSSIKTYLQSLAFMARLRGWHKPQIHHSDVKFILLGVKRKGIQPPSRKPMLKSYLKKLYGVLRFDTPLIKQFWTACILLFRALLRVSHIIPSDHTLCWSDVKFKRWGVLLYIRSAKCIPREGLVIPLAFTQDKRFCVSSWLKKLFLSRSGCTVFPMLDYSSFRGLLKVNLIRAGVTVHLTSHSFRRGGASYLANMGVSVNQIKDRGGWKSDCVYKYISTPLDVKIDRELRWSKTFT